MVINYSGEDFKSVIKNRVLVDFYANWCGPCKLLAPELEKVSGDINVVKVDVDKYQELAKKYGVMSIPCIILFDGGNEIKRNIGFMPASKLKSFYEQ